MKLMKRRRSQVERAYVSREIDLLAVGSSQETRVLPINGFALGESHCNVLSPSTYVTNELQHHCTRVVRARLTSFVR